jgi:cytochrome c553
MRSILACLALFTGAAFIAPATARAQAQPDVAKPDPKAIEFFESRVRPLLVEHCYKCHSAGATSLKGGLALDGRDALLKGGEHGAVVVPGDPGKSVLIRAVRRQGDLQMPPKHKLTGEQVQVLTRWVKIGAPWPAELAQRADYANESGAKYEQIRREHWSFQPVRKPEPPPPARQGWARTDVDRFVLAGLEEKGLKPSPEADRRTLLRRATYDLTGLPPTPEEVEAFVNDNSAKAFEKVVDRLLASPAFGERWGRHWLDVARYAESTGMTRNVPFYYAWRYRDYVIDAFNADTPYDQFVREQIAGDLLPAEDAAERDRRRVATGFLVIGPKDLNERNPVQFTLNNVDEQIDTTTRAFLGMTVSCARCHDHKFDPIPTAEYYALAGIFRSTELLAGVTPRVNGPKKEYYDPNLLLPLSDHSVPAKQPLTDMSDAEADVVPIADVLPVADERPKAQPADAKQARKQQAREAARKKKEEEIRRKRQEARRKMLQQRQRGEPGPEREIRAVAVGVRDGRIPADSHVFVRGELKERGPIVPRGTITLPGTDGLGTIPADRSGRLELANWVTSRQNPLTARVMVNRVWQHLFGQGLVTTVDNFGTTGEPPSHPELLDHLAAEFMDDGWSVKRAVRRLVLSRAYQQASAFDEAKFAVDPENKLLWRMSQRRLEGEAIRDAVLAAAGNLSRARPVGSPVLNVPPQGLMRRANLEGRFAVEHNCRSVYLPIFRGFVPDALDVFDLADNNNVTGSRDVTTVAPQALFMMNDPFVLAQSQAFARRVTTERAADLARIDRAYSLALGRVPNDAERQRALRYVREFADGARDPKKVTPIDPWTALCQALLASAEFRYVN